MTKRIVCALALFSLTGCASLHIPPTTLATYDFGPQHQPSNSTQPFLQQKKSLLIADATAPTWLENTAIHYRLSYHNPSQSYTYASSRWIAPPAAILTQKIRDRIVADTQAQVIKNSSTAKADYILHIELDELIQVFDAMNESHVVMSIRASLIERNSRHLFAQKDLSVKEQAPTADAAGAVFALSSASNQLIQELIAWLTIQLPPNEPALSRQN